jgi:hypothetical protein
MTPKTLMSIEEFTALPDDGMLHELNEGELISSGNVRNSVESSDSRVTHSTTPFYA